MMASIAPRVRLLPSRTALRSLLHAAVAAYLVILSLQAINSAAQQPSPEPLADGNSLALYGGQEQTAPAAPAAAGRIPVAVPDGMQQLKQTFKILGIICRDEVDRSVFVRDLSTGDERIYRVGDILNGAALTEIHSSYVVLQRGSTRMVIDINAPERDRLHEEQDSAG